MKFRPTSLRTRQPTGLYLQRNISRGAEIKVSTENRVSGVGRPRGFLYRSKLEFCARFFIILIPAMSSFQHCQGVSNALGNLDWPSWTRDTRAEPLPGRDGRYARHKQ